MNTCLFASIENTWLLTGWTMIHFLWLGTLVAVAALLSRWLLRRASANVRYAVALASLSVLAALPIAIATWLHEFSPSIEAAGRPLQNESAKQVAKTEQGGPIELKNIEPTIPATPSDFEKSATPIAAQSAPRTVQSTELTIAAPLPTTFANATADPFSFAVFAINASVRDLPWLWLIGTPLTFALTATGLLGARRLRSASRPITDGPIAEAFEKLAASLRLSRRVAVAVCDRIAAPVLIGILRPIILLPPAALTGYAPDEIEMVLLHELAHVRRWDNLVNLMQRLVESLLFFHPAVWLISSWVRRERESCCDALVVTRTDRPHAYAELLVALAAQMPRSVLFHPAASSAMAAGPLRSRIRRILKLDDDPMLISGKSFAAVLAALLLVGTLAVLYLPTIGQAEQRTTQPTGSNETAKEKGQIGAENDKTPKADPELLSFVIKGGKSGQSVILLNNKSITEDVIRVMLRERGKSIADLPVSLQADAGISYAKVMQMIELLESLGVKKLALDTRNVVATDAQFKASFTANKDNPMVTRTHDVPPSLRKTLPSTFEGWQKDSYGPQLKFEVTWNADHSQVQITAPTAAQDLLAAELKIDDSRARGMITTLPIAANKPAGTAAKGDKAPSSKFPTLEEQKLADLAWKRLQLELEPLNEKDLKRVQALGYEGGLKIIGGHGQMMERDKQIQWDDILVGLHVWPVTNFANLAEVLNRNDIAELNPLKYYVIRHYDDHENPPRDAVLTGRIGVILQEERSGNSYRTRSSSSSSSTNPPTSKMPTAATGDIASPYEALFKSGREVEAQFNEAKNKIEAERDSVKREMEKSQRQREEARSAVESAKRELEQAQQPTKPRPAVAGNATAVEVKANDPVKPQPKASQTVYAELDGVIKTVKVAFGDRVHKNDVLLVLESPNLEKEIESIHRQLQQAIAIVRLNTAKSDSKENLSEAEKKVKEHELAPIKESITSYNKQLDLLNARKAMLKIVSPIEGRVVTPNVEERLLERPVFRGEKLLEIAEPTQDLELERKLKVTYNLDPAVAKDKTSVPAVPTQSTSTSWRERKKEAPAEAVFVAYDISPELKSEVQQYFRKTGARSMTDERGRRYVVQSSPAWHEQFAALLKATPEWSDSAAAKERAAAPIVMKKVGNEDVLEWRSVGLTFKPMEKPRFSHSPGEAFIAVSEVAPGSPAAWADIRPGDVLTDIGSFNARSMPEVLSLLKALGEGLQSKKDVTVRFIRESPTRSTSITADFTIGPEDLGAKPADPNSAKPTSEAKPGPVANEKVRLSYEGKSFGTWRSAWQSELSTEKRVEAVNALTAFGANGYGREAAESILDVADQYDWMATVRLDRQTTYEPEGKLQRAISGALVGGPGAVSIDPKYWLPALKKRYEADPAKWQNAAILLLAQLSSKTEAQNDDVRSMLLKLSQSKNERIASQAYDTLVRRYPDNEELTKLLAKLFQDKAHWISAVRWLGWTPQYPPEVIDLLLHGSRKQQAEARKTFRDIPSTPAKKALVATMIAILNDDSKTADHIAAIRALGALGPDGSFGQHEALQLLEEIVKKAPLDKKAAAAFALQYATRDKFHTIVLLEQYGGEPEGVGLNPDEAQAAFNKELEAFNGN